MLTRDEESVQAHFAFMAFAAATLGSRADSAGLATRTAVSAPEPEQEQEQMQAERAS